MTEERSNGLNGDAVKHLVTKCFLAAIRHNAGGKYCSNRSLNVQPADPRVLQPVYKNQQVERAKYKDGAKYKGIAMSKKTFVGSILNTVVEVTIYLMPAKLACTSGAGYLVQLFMISSKI